MISATLKRRIVASTRGMALGLLVLASVENSHAIGYQTYEAWSARLKALAQAHPNVVSVTSLAKTSSGKDVWLAAVNLANAGTNSPAMLSVAGLEGNDLAGTSVLMEWIETLVTNAPTALGTNLKPTVVYVVPCANPDAAKLMFDSPRRESSTDFTPMDQDHDGMTDEDGPEDVNGDGMVTSMRVQDPDGDYIPDPLDPRLMIKADASKGEAGAWRVMVEGRDNDGDEQWNEDPIGGVNLNRNFPYQFKFFGAESGAHPLSQPIARAIADFVVTHPNIGLVFSFGQVDNLGKTPKGETPKRPPVALHEGDVPIYKELGKSWRETMGLKKELDAPSEPGTFTDWAYYHRGVLGLATRAWSPALQLEINKSASTIKTNEPVKEKDKEKEKEGSSDKKADSSRNEENRQYLKWIESVNTNSFVRWTRIEHPDFSGKVVEVGGFAPFASSNPPESALRDVAAKQIQFLNTLPGKLPRVELRKTEVKALGNGVYDITADVANTGYLPTALSQGELTREVLPTRVLLDVLDEAVLSGNRRVLLGPIQGSGGKMEVRWIVNGAGRSKVTVDVISALGGVLRKELELEEGKK